MDIKIFKNNTLEEINKIDLEIQKSKGVNSTSDGITDIDIDLEYIGLRCFLIPYKDIPGEGKIVDMNDFDKVDMFVWDGNFSHNHVITTMKVFQEYFTTEKIENVHNKDNITNKKNKIRIEITDIFKGIREPFSVEGFTIGPIFDSFDTTSKLKQHALKACEIIEKELSVTVSIS